MIYELEETLQWPRSTWGRRMAVEFSRIVAKKPQSRYPMAGGRKQEPLPIYYIYFGVNTLQVFFYSVLYIFLLPYLFVTLK